MPRNRPDSSPTNVGNKKICCVFNWDPTTGDEATGYTRSCAAVPDDISAADCTALRAITLPDGTVVQRPNGELVDCCRDCNTIQRVLTVANGKLVWIGALATTPIEEPEKCCCGDTGCCQQVPDCTQVDCYPTPPDECDPCKGKCISHQYVEDPDDENYGDEILEDRDVLCATKLQCCADNDGQCSQSCTEYPGPVSVPITYEPPENSWLPMPCTKCGTCCQHVYDLTFNSPTYGQSVFTTYAGDVTEDECKALTYDANIVPPGPALGPFGIWTPNVDDPRLCNPQCCEELVRGNEIAVACRHTEEIACDPCKGKCIDLTADADPALCPKDTCRTKQECCGDGGEKCIPGLCGDTALFRWESLSCGTDPDSCGVCCQNIYNDDGTAVTGITCDQSRSNREMCEALTEQLSGPKPYGVWHSFATCAACNPTPCCRQITCADGTTKAVCVNVAPEDCNPCNGRCIELNPDGSDGNETCATRQECCGAQGSNCDATWCGNTPTHRWEPTCPENILRCGVCCRTLYSIDPDTGEQTYFSSECRDNVPEASECVLTDEERDALLPGFTALYAWRAYENCDTVVCNQKTCCGPTCPNDVGCITVDVDEPCDPCNGRCFNKSTGEKFCATKQECCGDDGWLCRDCPGSDGPDAAFEWSGCFENGFKCGICCQLTLNSVGVPVSSECHDDITYEECIALPNASWKAFETCDSAICIPKPCCNDEICPGQVICTTVDKNRGVCDPCRGECYAIDADGVQIGDAYCATKQACCGELNERCAPPPNLCPDGGVALPTHVWVGFPPEGCADPELCGVCCKKNVAEGGAITYTCDGTVDNITDCQANDFGVWHAFETCAACNETKPTCIETQCTIIVNGEEVTVPNAVCRPVAVNQATCDGICTEFATDARPYDITTCKTKSECCGPNNIRCGNNCNSEPTHSWSTSCVDPNECGVCCLITNIGDGNPTASCQENIGAEACALLNTANGGLGVTAQWIPFGACPDCSIQKCCGTCPDGSIACVDIEPPGICPQPCNGKCTFLDADGNPDPTIPPVCMSRAECCIQNGINVCLNECPNGRTWEPTCPENAAKCGVACKTFRNASNVVISSTCQPEIDTYVKYLAAIPAAQAEGATLEWHPWETCETVICHSKTCCKEVCPGVTACAIVDINDPCDKCTGLCYDAVVDPDTGAYSIAPGAQPVCSTRVNCCGLQNEKCAAVPNCPQGNPKVYVPCCEDDVGGICQCAGDPNYAANFFTTSGNYGPPTNPGTIQESCLTYLSPSSFNAFWNATPIPLSFGRGPEIVGGVIGQSYIEDPCYFRCNQFLGLGGGQWENCISAQNQLHTPALAWRDCYPGLLQGRPVYVFGRRRYASWYPGGDGVVRSYAPGEKISHYESAQNVSFYVCSGKKLVDITNAAVEVRPVKLCNHTEKRTKTVCTFQAVLFEHCDCEALGVPCNPPPGVVPASVYGFDNTWGTIASAAPASTRRCANAHEPLTFNLTPMAADCYDRWGNKYASAGAPRQIFAVGTNPTQNATYCGCGQQDANGNPIVEITSERAEVTVHPFTSSFCFSDRAEWETDDYVGTPLPESESPFGLPRTANCCRRTSQIFDWAWNACEHDWNSEICENIVDSDLVEENFPANSCPQEMSENPLP